MHLKLNMPLKELSKFSADFFPLIVSHVLVNGGTIHPVSQAEEQKVILEMSAGLIPHMPTISKSFHERALICFHSPCPVPPANISWIIVTAFLICPFTSILVS